MKYRTLLIIFLTILFISCETETEIEDVNIVKSENSIGMSFPPFADKEQIDFSIQNFEKLNVNKIKISSSWKYREPSKGEFYWEPLDTRLKSAIENNIEVMLMIPLEIPEWSCNGIEDETICENDGSQDFRNYVNELLQRYPNQIDRIQFGNEWDREFDLNFEEFVKYNNILYNRTKIYSPETEVVLGGITISYPIKKRFCDNLNELDFTGMEFKDEYDTSSIRNIIDEEICRWDYDYVDYVFQNAKYDLVDIHIYDDSNNWEEYLKEIPHERIIVTEFGGPHPRFEIYSEEYQAERLSKYLETISKLPIEDSYYFKLVDSKDSYHINSGLIDEQLKKKESYEVFSKFNN